MHEAVDAGGSQFERPGGVAAPRSVSQNMAVSALAEVASKVSTFLLIVVAARSLDESDFGAFAYAVAFSLLVITLVQWGFDSILEREGSADPRALPRLIAHSLCWRSIIAVPLFIVSTVVQWQTRPSHEAALALVLVLLGTLVDSYSEVGRSVATACQHQAGVALAQVCQRLTAALVGIAALVAGLGLVGVAAGYLAGSLTGGILVLLATRRLGVRSDLRAVTRDGMRSMGRNASAVGFAALCSVLMLRLGPVLLGWWKRPEALAAFTVAFRLLETVLFASWAVRRAAFPVMSSTSDPARARASLQQAISVVAVLYVPFAALVLLDAPGILGAIFGDPYDRTATAALRWLALAPLLYGTAHLTTFALLARDRRAQLLRSSVIAALVGVTASCALIPPFGATGAAAAVTLSLATGAVVQLVQLRAAVGRIRITSVLALPIAIALPVTILLAATGLPTLIDGPVFALAYLPAWFLLARRDPADTSAYALLRRQAAST